MHRTAFTRGLRAMVIASGAIWVDWILLPLRASEMIPQYESSFDDLTKNSTIHRFVFIFVLDAFRNFVVGLSSSASDGEALGYARLVLDANT